MAATVDSVRDLLPVPAIVSPMTDPDRTEQNDTMGEEPTISHSLALSPQEEQGGVQKSDTPNDSDEDELADLGWNETPEHIPKPLVGGLPNEELWLLVRRFNKQMYHVKEMVQPPPGRLDLNIAEEDDFSPDKLRASLERLYMTVIIGAFAFGKHLVRLRSWKESQRTTAFCVIYFAAWSFDLLIPLFSATIILLIIYPPARSFLFPPAPIALVDSSTGGLQKPKTGTLGSHDSATGAPENYKGEAVEQEAANFVNSVASITLSSATGKHPTDENANETEAHENEALGKSAPDPTAIAMAAAGAKDTAQSGASGGSKKDKTKVPMETAMWTMMRPLMHGLGDITDTWERFANALSPTPPFPQEVPRLRIAFAMVPLLCLSLYVTPYMFIKSTTFGAGFGFFGDPLITPSLAWFNKRFPNWQKVLELRNTLLKGVPTNAQLTITLLRLGEAHKAPLPPPPRNAEAPPDVPAAIGSENLNTTGSDRPLAASPEEVAAMVQHDPKKASEVNGEDIFKSKESQHGQKGSRIIGFFRGTTRAAVESAITADSVKAKAGSTPAKARLGAVPRPAPDYESGPVEFKSRNNGHRGHLYISAVPDAKLESAKVWFTRDSVLNKSGAKAPSKQQDQAEWRLTVGDIAELKKVGGYGWKTKLVVGWALEKKINDGLEIVTRQGQTFKITACPLRDELFNRLIAMGGQKWESW